MAHYYPKLTAEQAAAELREMQRLLIEKHTAEQTANRPGHRLDPTRARRIAALTRALKSLRAEPGQQGQLLTVARTIPTSAASYRPDA